MAMASVLVLVPVPVPVPVPVLVPVLVLVLVLVPVLVLVLVLARVPVPALVLALVLVLAWALAWAWASVLALALASRHPNTRPCPPKHPTIPIAPGCHPASTTCCDSCGRYRSRASRPVHRRWCSTTAQNNPRGWAPVRAWDSGPAQAPERASEQASELAMARVPVPARRNPDRATAWACSPGSTPHRDTRCGSATPGKCGRCRSPWCRRNTWCLPATPLPTPWLHEPKKEAPRTGRCGIF